jgi:hypothetical protein
MADIWDRRGRPLREIAKAAVDTPNLSPAADTSLADSWSASASPSGLWTQIGGGGEYLCPNTRPKAGRWTITVWDRNTGECGRWDLRTLRRELEREKAGREVQAALL